jgi:hypothetical protein
MLLALFQRADAGSVLSRAAFSETHQDQKTRRYVCRCHARNDVGIGQAAWIISIVRHGNSNGSRLKGNRADRVDLPGGLRL